MTRRSFREWPVNPIERAVVAALIVFILAVPSAGAANASVSPVRHVVRPVASPAVRWPWPTAPPVVVARSFVAPATPYSAGHRGIDLAAGTGAEVRSPADGVVAFVGVVVDRPVLTLDVGDDLLVSFEPLEPAVVRGERVARDQVVGRVSEGGHCAAVCLHVGVRLRGAYVSPLLFFDRVPRAVLLPLH